MSTLTTQELQQQYIAYFGRPGDPQGIEYWLNESDITTAKEFALKISAQDEYSKGIGAEPVADQVNALYVNLFGRTADADGLIYWTNQVTKGVLSLGNLAYDLIVAAGNPVEGNEGQAALDAQALSKKTAAAQIFTDNVKAGGFILDYDNDAAFDVARSFVTTVKADSQFTAQQLTTFTQGQVVAMSNASKASSSSGAALTSDLSVVEQAQLQAAQAQTATAQAQLAVANQAAADAAAAKAEAAAAAEAAKNAPTTYKFTKTTDSLVGEGGGDTFTGVIQAGVADGTTIFPGDSADGGEGEDKITISIAGANPVDATPNPDDYTLAAVGLNNIETVLVSNFETSTGDGGVPTDPTWNVFDAALWDGVKTVGVNASSDTGETRFNLMKNFVDAEMRNGSGDLYLDYNGTQKVTGLSDTQKVTVAGMTAGDLFVPGVENIEIVSEISKSTLGALNWTQAGAAEAGHAIEKLTISGDQNLKITDPIPFGVATNGKQIDATVDASAATGNVTLNVSGTVSTLSVTGGSGDDTFNFGANGGLTTNDVVDGGDGVDTLLIDAEVLDTQATQVTNVETFGFNPVANADSVIDEAKLPASFKTIQVDGSDNVAAGNEAQFRLDNVEQGTSVNIKKTVADVNGVPAATNHAANNGVEVIINEASDNDTNSIDITLDAVGGYNSVVAGKVGFGIEEVDFANYETVNISSDKNKAGTVKNNEVRTLTATATKTLTFDGAADLRIGDITTGVLGLTTVDASALTGKFQLDNHSAGSLLGTTFKLPNTQNTIALAGTLNNKDTVTGGTHPTDKLTASITGLTPVTGVLKITDIETIDFTTTGANTLDLAGVTGAKTISVTENQQTFTNYDLGSTTRIEARSDAAVTGNATFVITGADASGDSDTLYMRTEMARNADVTNSLNSTGIETLDLVIEDEEATAANTNIWNLTNFDGTTVKVTRGTGDLATDPAGVNLGVLHENTLNVDTSDLKGIQSVDATQTKSAFTLNAGGTGTVTASSGEWNDTYTIGKTVIPHSITGGDGSDTLNITVDAAFTDVRNLAVENLVIDVVPGATIDVGQAFVAPGATNGPTSITIKGGNSLSVFDVETAAAALFNAGVTKVDASEFGGKVELDFADNSLDDTVTITAGSLTTDQARVTNTTQDLTHKPKTTGVEKLIITTNTAAGSRTSTLDLSNASGVTAIEPYLAAGDILVVDKLAGEKITLKGAGAAAVLSAKLADDSGATDTFTFELFTDAVLGTPIANDTQLQLTDVETVTIHAFVADQVNASGIAMDADNKTLTLNIKGAVEVSTNATNADVDTIDASFMTEGGFYNQDPAGNGTGRARTKSVTYTGSVGDDTFIMANADDVIDGGSQAAGTTGDMLRMSPTMELLIGGVIVDLSKDDVVTTLNGLGNTAAQSGFESVDLSLMQPGSFGSLITANAKGSTIVGLTGAVTARNIITGDKGNDDIRGGSAQDRIIPGKGNNTIRFGAEEGATVTANESIELDATNTGTDTFSFDITTDFSGVLAQAGAGAVGNFVGLDAINLADNVTVTMAPAQVTGAAAGSITVNGTTAGGNADTLAFTLPATGTYSFDAILATNTSAVVNITGSGAADIVTGSRGNDIISGGGGIDALSGGDGNDTLDGGALVDTLTGGAGNDRFVMGIVNANRNNVADFVTTADDIILTNTAGGVVGADAGALVNVAGIAGLTIDDIVVDTAANLGAAAVTVGNQSAKFSSGGYAYASDTGTLFYDADGNFGAAVITLGVITRSGGALVAGDFNFG